MGVAKNQGLCSFEGDLRDNAPFLMERFVIKRLRIRILPVDLCTFQASQELIYEHQQVVIS